MKLRVGGNFIPKLIDSLRLFSSYITCIVEQLFFVNNPVCLWFESFEYLWWTTKYVERCIRILDGCFVNLISDMTQLPQEKVLSSKPPKELDIEQKEYECTSEHENSNPSIQS